jgi:hypothetical protein
MSCLHLYLLYIRIAAPLQSHYAVLYCNDQIYYAQFLNAMLSTSFSRTAFHSSFNFIFSFDLLHHLSTPRQLNCVMLYCSVPCSHQHNSKASIVRDAARKITKLLYVRSRILLRTTRNPHRPKVQQPTPYHQTHVSQNIHINTSLTPSAYKFSCAFFFLSILLFASFC